MKTEASHPDSVDILIFGRWCFCFHLFENLLDDCLNIPIDYLVFGLGLRGTKFTLIAYYGWIAVCLLLLMLDCEKKRSRGVVLWILGFEIRSNLVEDFSVNVGDEGIMYFFLQAVMASNDANIHTIFLRTVHLFFLNKHVLSSLPNGP